MPTKSGVRDPHAPQLFRRGTTLTWSSIVTVFFLAVATAVGVSYKSHGVFSVLAPYAVVLPIVIFAIIGMAWPHVIVRDADMTVCNSFASFRIPYQLIKDVRQVRIGMLVEPHHGKIVPVTAYASGSGAGKMFSHNKSASRLMDAIEDKLTFAPSEPGDAAIVRTIETRNIIISVAALIISVTVILLAVATYH